MPLQWAYSEALSAQPRLNRDDFSCWQKAAILLRGSKRSSSGSPFQVEGPTIEKARCCLRDERTRRKRSSPLAEEQSPTGGQIRDWTTEVRKVGWSTPSDRDTSSLTPPSYTGVEKTKEISKWDFVFWFFWFFGFLVFCFIGIFISKFFWFWNIEIIKN